MHFCADGDTIETVFRTIVSVNQLSIYGTVSDSCDQYRACQARTERRVLAGQSDPLFEPASLLMTTPTPSTEVLAEEDLLQKYKERVERLSQQNRLMAKEMGSPRQVVNRRRTREGPELACVRSPVLQGWHMQGGEG